MPLLTRRGIFFGATVEPGFLESGDGRRLLRSWRWQVALWSVVAVVAGILLLRQNPALAVVLPMSGLVMAAGLSYWRKFREVHARYGVSRPEIREVTLAPAGQQRPSLWLVLPPLLAIVAVALYLHAHWDRIPLRFPVRWATDGQPQAWASRDPRGIYGPLLMAGLLTSFLLALTWAIWRFSRNTVMRHVTVRGLQLLLYPLTLTFLVTALLPLTNASGRAIQGVLLALAGIMLLFIVGLIYWSYLRISAPGQMDEVPEPQSDSWWKAGMFYYNPRDPAILVSKRVGIGYTLNFANKWSWVALALLVLAIAASIVFGGVRPSR